MKSIKKLAAELGIVGVILLCIGSYASWREFSTGEYLSGIGLVVLMIVFLGAHGAFKSFLRNRKTQDRKPAI